MGLNGISGNSGIPASWANLSPEKQKKLLQQKIEALTNIRGKGVLGLLPGGNDGIDRQLAACKVALNKLTLDIAKTKFDNSDVGIAVHDALETADFYASQKVKEGKDLGQR